jgi:hypothetical protein
MNTKTIVAGVLAGLAYFLLGWLMYGMLLQSTFSGMQGSATGVMRPDSEMVMWALVLGSLGMGFTLTYVFGTWAGVSSVAGGIKAGATLGFLIALGWDMMMFATSNIYQLNGAILDIVVFTINSAIAGAIAGWWLGRS